MPRPGSHTFTATAVQRAMDTRAAKWGAPPGYYSVESRLRKLSPSEQVWAVKVRLFGGRLRHVEMAVFIRKDHDAYGEIVYAALADAYSGPHAYKLDRAPRPAPRPTPEVNPNREPVHTPREERYDYLPQLETAKTALMRGTQWTQSEERTLREDTINGVPIVETARKLGRTYHGTSQRRVVLGLTKLKPRKES